MSLESFQSSSSSESTSSSVSFMTEPIPGKIWWIELYEYEDHKYMKKYMK